MNNQPCIIGVTGGIGSGKSLICRIFNILGAATYDADSRARHLMTADSTLKNNIISIFGEKAYQKGQLNKTFIAQQIFSDDKKRTLLNNKVHPVVQTDFEKWQERQKAPLLIKEAALLVQTGSYRSLDALIVVTCPDNIRVQRVLARDPHRTEKDILAIIDKQWPQSSLTKHAQHIIPNDNSQLIIPLIEQIYTQYKNTK